MKGVGSAGRSGVLRDSTAAARPAHPPPAAPSAAPTCVQCPRSGVCLPGTECAISAAVGGLRVHIRNTAPASALPGSAITRFR